MEKKYKLSTDLDLLLKILYIINAIYNIYKILNSYIKKGGGKEKKNKNGCPTFFMWKFPVVKNPINIP